MKNEIRNMMITLCSMLILSTTGAAQEGFSYEGYDKVVRTYVNDKGRVNYADLKANLAELQKFIDQIAAVGPENKPELFASDDEKKRYYLTAYNAWVLYLAAKAYPDKHYLWSRIGFFKNKDITLGGKEISLNHLEHNIIRKQFLDPRIHFFLNCGAVSCPPLKGAIAQNATDAELEKAATQFINDTANVKYDAATKTLYLSKIFDWFEGDFLNYLKARRGLDKPHIAEYIRIYLKGEAGKQLAAVSVEQIKVKHLSYDKDLNVQ